MMSRMELLVHGWEVVHGVMQDELPSVDEQESDEDFHGGEDIGVDEMDDIVGEVFGDDMWAHDCVQPVFDSPHVVLFVTRVFWAVDLVGGVPDDCLDDVL